MQDFQKTGMAYSEQFLNNMFDELARQWIMLYYWPYFVVGNLDDWMKLGMTLNGARPVNKS